jgi:hypothetical protein
MTDGGVRRRRVIEPVYDGRRGVADRAASDADTKSPNQAMLM